ncbi:MAG TPA: radical SAM protein, partial [Candidatus Methanoperedens sp.]|nr:radical SAM protein [Candidatus Methanoperedens sp.]
MIGVQFSRGCPFNCEFCDVIELFGRKVRLKEPAQVIRELEELHRLGYRGHVDFVDDNLIGNRPRARELLREVVAWSARRGHPFFFSTEASINLADDPELLRLMQEADFRYVFVGIESADPGVLAANRKLQNVNRTLVEDLAAIYRHGIVVNAGFIVGFDTETRESARLALGFVRLIRAMGVTGLRARLFWRNVLAILVSRPANLDIAVNL